MDWHSTLTGFDILSGFSIEDLQASCDAIPEAAGVYKGHPRNVSLEAGRRALEVLANKPRIGR